MCEVIGKTYRLGLQGELGRIIGLLGQLSFKRAAIFRFAFVLSS